MPDALVDWWLLFLAYSIAGWCCETLLCSVHEGHFVNRGFLNGPYCPVYGTGSLAAVVLLRGITNPLELFVLGGLITCTIEYLTSWAMEAVYHARWWDYSAHPLNLHGRVWVGGFAEFGAGIVVVVLIAQPGLMTLLALAPYGARELAALLTLLVFLGDLVITHVGLTELRRKVDGLVGELRAGMETLRESIPSREEFMGAMRWQRMADWSPRGSLESAQRRLHELRAGSAVLDTLDELARGFSSRLNSQERRIMRAFPGLRPLGYERLIEELYEQIRRQGK